MRGWFSFSVILIVLLFSLPLTIVEAQDGNIILYVDDDNVEGPWDGSIEHPYQHIQDAIDIAKKGDTIYVYNGTYFENLAVDNEIQIYGENREKTTIRNRGSGDVIYIASSNVSIEEFTIEHNGTQSKDAGIKNELYAGHLSLSNNMIRYCREGIYLRHSCNNIITNNTFMDLNFGAISIFSECNDNMIFGNTIGPNTIRGITVLKSSGNVISKNIIRCVLSAGICLDSSDRNILSENVICLNLHTGMRIEGSENFVKGNVFFLNSLFGLYLDESDSPNNEIRNNRFSLNHIGIYLGANQGNMIQSNNFFHNLRDVFFINPENIFQGNYWGRPHILPKILFSYEDLNDPDPDMFIFDWHPAWKPNEIAGDPL
jgi:nitrous oxidase accessory protein